MSDNTSHGGARKNAGRKPGSKNKVSKSALAQQLCAEYLSKNLPDYLDILDSIARNPEEKTSERRGAIRDLCDRGMGRAKETIEIVAPEDVASEDAQELLGLWTTVDAAPPIEDGVHPPADAPEDEPATMTE